MKTPQNAVFLCFTLEGPFSWLQIKLTKNLTPRLSIPQWFLGVGPEKIRKLVRTNIYWGSFCVFCSIQVIFYLQWLLFWIQNVTGQTQKSENSFFHCEWQTFNGINSSQIVVADFGDLEKQPARSDFSTRCKCVPKNMHPKCSKTGGVKESVFWPTFGLFLTSFAPPCGSGFWFWCFPEM